MVNIMIMLLVGTNAVTLFILIDLMRRFFTFRKECQVIMVKICKDLDGIDTDLDQVKLDVARYLFKQKLQGDDE